MYCWLCNNPERDDLFHYPPDDQRSINAAVREFIKDKKTKSFSFFVPGKDWEKDEQGKWKLVPDPQYKNEFLKAALHILQENNIPYEFYAYNEHRSAGVWGQGTAGVTFEGKIYLEGMSINA